MKNLLTVALLLGSVSAFAGVGGYSSTTCVSSSGRTVVTAAFNDGEDIIMTLIQDGQAAVYSSKDKSVRFDGNSQVLIAKKNNSINLALEMTGTTRELTIHNDPRSGTFAQQNAKTDVQRLSVSCKTFTQQP